MTIHARAVPEITHESRAEFYVWCKASKHRPYKKHHSQADAEAEAIWLALENPGKKFHVVQNRAAFTATAAVEAA